MCRLWNGGDLVDADDYRYLYLLYKLSLKVEVLEKQPRLPLRPMPILVMRGSDYVMSNEMAIEFNRFDIPKPKRIKKRFLFW